MPIRPGSSVATVVAAQCRNRCGDTGFPNAAHVRSDITRAIAFAVRGRPCPAGPERAMLVGTWKHRAHVSEIYVQIRHEHLRHGNFEVPSRLRLRAVEDHAPFFSNSPQCAPTQISEKVRRRSGLHASRAIINPSR